MMTYWYIDGLKSCTRVELVNIARNEFLRLYEYKQLFINAGILTT